jgi:hypothetical protein
LNQQARLVPPLGRAGDFFAVPEQIEFLVADEALSRQGFLGERRQFGFHLQCRESPPQPVMDAPVAFHGLERMPFMARRKRGAVGPVRVVRHDAAAGRPADERAQQRGAGHLRVFLEIAERGRALRPAVKPQHRPAQARDGFQQRLVQRHVEGRLTGAGLEDEIVLGRGKTFNIQH